MRQRARTHGQFVNCITKKPVIEGFRAISKAVVAHEHINEVTRWLPSTLWVVCVFSNPVYYSL